MLDRMQRLRRGALTAVGMATAVVVLAGCGGGTGADNEQNALHPAGPAAHKILNLFTPFFWIAVVIGVGVVARDHLRRDALPGEARRGAQPGAGARQHRARGQLDDHPVPDPRGHGRARPSRRSSTSPRCPTGPDVVHITVDGRQWWWQYQYTDNGNGFDTANEMHIPIDRPVFLTLTSNNVIHSFWVPELDRQEGRRARPPATRSRSRRPARHVPRAVRRVLRPLARQHAPARRSPRPQADYDDVGRSADRRRCRQPTADEFDKASTTRSGAARRATRSRTASTTTSARRSARTSRTSATAHGVRRRHLPDEARRPLEVDLRRAEPQAARATLARLDAQLREPRT